MTDIPQLGPEVYVDDDDIAKQARTMVSPLLSPPSPMDMVDKSDSRSSFIAHGLDGAARHRRGSSLGQYPPGPLSPNSPGISPGVSPRGSPQLSPHRPTNSAYSFEGGELTDGAAGSAHSSRRGSAVRAEDVLEVLDNSAWGESIRRSFTMRRPNRGGTA